MDGYVRLGLDCHSTSNCTVVVNNTLLLHSVRAMYSVVPTTDSGMQRVCVCVCGRIVRCWYRD